MFPVIFLAVEIALIAVIRTVVRRRGDLVRSRRVVCPIDGSSTRIYVLGPEGDRSPADLVRCDRLESGHGGSCDRSCLRR